jgi:flavin reductase (DIM6/NTAB) family NADH-FMN oxidoreductase RutF
MTAPASTSVLAPNIRGFVRSRLRPLPQWSAIAVHRPQELIGVQLLAGGAQFEVTANNVIAALKPLTIAIGLDAPLQRAIERDDGTALRFVDRHTGRVVGSLHLRRIGAQQTGDAQIGLFDVVDDRQRCVQWPYRPWNRYLQNRAALRNDSPGNFSMAPKPLQRIMIFYICPRPVVLVSVDDGRHSNIFPMDLIGPLVPDVFTLALRSSSQSIGTMKSARRAALSDIAASDVKIAHALGIHHKQMQVDWDRLPFAVESSLQFSLPVPATALCVREIEIIDHEEIGSHTFFICRIVSERPVREGNQLHHTSGIYEHFRIHRGKPLMRP